MKTKLSPIATLLARDPEVILVYLFGSVATKTTHGLSDTDIAVLLKLKDQKNLVQKERDLSLLLAEQGIAHIDLTILNVAGIELCHRVITTGKLLFARSEQDRVQFEEKTFLDFFRDEPFFKEYDAMVYQQIKSSHTR